MDNECLSAGYQEAIIDFDSGTLLGVFLMSFFLSVMLAPVVLWFYQKRVEKLISTQTSDVNGGDHAFESGAMSSTAAILKPEVNSIRASVLLEAVMAGAKNTRHAMFAGATTFAALVALVISIGSMFLNKHDLLSLSEWLSASVYAVVVAVVAIAPVVLISTQHSKRQLILLGLPSLLVATIVVDVLWYNEATDVTEKVALIAVGTIAVGMLYIALTGRRMRNVVPLLTLFISLLFFAFFFAGFFLIVVASCESTDVLLLGFALCVVSGWVVLRLGSALLQRLTGAYERYAFSDTQFQVGMWLVVIVIVLAMDLTPEDDDVYFSPWSIGVPLALAAGIAVYARCLKRITPWPMPQPLLLLRVFSKNTGTQRMLDEISHQWSYIGPVLLVGGPDLAKTYLEPHELLLLLRRRLKEQFVLTRSDLNYRLLHLEYRADPDGRYRINEFFCADNMWRPTVDRLVDLTPVVLLDARDFDASREGTAYEITLLAQKNALSRTILLIDGKTDLRALDSALAEVAGADIPSSHRIAVDRAVTSTDVVRALLNCIRVDK